MLKDQSLENIQNDKYCLENEIWRDVIGFEGSHQVSNLGRVRTVDRYYTKKNSIISGDLFFLRGRILSTHKNKDGYLVVRINRPRSSNLKSFNKRVHRLVAESFLGVRENMTVNHIDTVRDNNKVENLEWLSHRENIRHSALKGRYSRFGVSNSRSKLTMEDVRDIKILRSKLRTKVKDIATHYKVSEATIYKVLRGETYVR